MGILSARSLRTPATNFYVDSSWCRAKEETKIHVEAANPANAITKAEARDLLKRVAYVLREYYGIGARGSGKDVVLLLSSGSPFLAIIFYAIAAVGGVFSGASTAYRTGEIVRQVKDADARLLVCSSEYKTLAIETAKQSGISSDRVLVLDNNSPKQWTLFSPDGIDMLQRGNGQKIDWQRVSDQRQLEDTTIALLYSSGTTG